MHREHQNYKITRRAQKTEHKATAHNDITRYKNQKTEGTKQGKIRQDKTRQGQTQNKTRHKTRQEPDKTRQGKTRQDKARQGKRQKA